MGVYYDNKRDMWVARISLNGKRVFLGRFDEERKAIVAYARVELMNEMMLHFTLENYKVDFIEDDISIEWLEPFRRMKLEKVASRLRTAIIATLMSVLRRSRKAQHDRD